MSCSIRRPGSHDNYLSVFSFTETDNGGWEEAAGVPILMPGAAYDVVVEVLSAITRRTSIRLKVYYDSGNWIIRNALALPIRGAETK
jgi:hypothetical protein